MGIGLGRVKTQMQGRGGEEGQSGRQSQTGD